MAAFPIFSDLSLQGLIVSNSFLKDVFIRRQRSMWTICVSGCLVVNSASLITDQIRQRLSNLQDDVYNWYNSWKLGLRQVNALQQCVIHYKVMQESKMHRYTRIKPGYSALGSLSEPIDDNLICVFVNQSHPQKNGTRATAWTWKCVEWANRQCCFKLFKCCAQRQTNLTGFCSLIRWVCRADDAKTHTQTCTRAYVSACSPCNLTLLTVTLNSH